MQDIKELDLKGLEERLLFLGAPKYHARSIFDWIYRKGVSDFGKMSNLSASLRKELAEEFKILGIRELSRQESADKTAKFLFRMEDSNLVEAVIIPMKRRLQGSGDSRSFTGCISSQAGCKFACGFCASGMKGFRRNLTRGEILDQVFYLKNGVSGGNLTNIVFMGTGEPFDNYDNVLSAVRLINSSSGFNIGARRITISTCGIIPGIEKLAKEDLQVELSISLHAADDKLRSKLMPVNKKYPLADLIRCCREYIAKTNRQVTFEYILIKDINSDPASARRLVSLLKGLRLAKVNLIPANFLPELKIESPERLQVNFFKECLTEAGLEVTLRKERGQDIDAACGQLRLKYENC